MIVAQIGVGEHVIADLLAGAQAPAMADHQPGFGAKDGEVIADRLGVARADADIDQRDPAAVLAHQVIGGHLVAAPCGIGKLLARILGLFGQHHAARTRERRATIAAELRARPVDEFVDIAVIVREQDEALEMLGIGARIVGQPGEAEIGAQSVEQRQRDGIVGIVQFDPVGQFVADVGEVGRGEMARDLVGIDPRQFRTRRAVEHVGERHFLARGADFDLDLVIA